MAKKTRYINRVNLDFATNLSENTEAGATKTYDKT